jgi:hypothetical protein
MNPNDLLVRLPTDPKLPYEYYAKIDDEKEMVDWVSDPAANDLLHIDQWFCRKYENLQVDNYDVMFQFTGMFGPLKSVQMIHAQDGHGEKKIGIESSWIYPEMVRLHLPEVEDARVIVYKCVPESQVLKIERRLAHLQRFLKKIVVPVGLSSITNYDPISGKCQIWIQNNLFKKSHQIRISSLSKPVVLSSRVFNLHELSEIHSVFKWAKETCSHVLVNTSQ